MTSLSFCSTHRRRHSRYHGGEDFVDETHAKIRSKQNIGVARARALL